MGKKDFIFHFLIKIPFLLVMLQSNAKLQLICHHTISDVSIAKWEIRKLFNLPFMSERQLQILHWGCGKATPPAIQDSVRE